MRIIATVTLLLSIAFGVGCSGSSDKDSDTLTVALSDKFSGLDTLSNTGADAAADRIRTLMFNSLVKKNEKFEYVGELAESYLVSSDGLSITFKLRDGVRFHNATVLTSGDVKYTLDELLRSNGVKAGSFFDSSINPKGESERIGHITGIETPDAKTIILKVSRPALVNQTLSNLVTIPIIPTGTFAKQKSSPIGSGPFKFVSFDNVNSIVRLESFSEYWEGAPKFKNLVVKTVTEPNALQAEIQSGNVDIAPLPTNLNATTLEALDRLPEISVSFFDGSNIQYLGFNMTAGILGDRKVRQAIAHAIDRKSIVDNLMKGQARLADSILPLESWAFARGEVYIHNPEKARTLLQESGYKGQTLKLKISASSASVRDYSLIIQDNLKKVGLMVEIDAVERNTLLAQLKQGQFEMTTNQWVGGNQDPIFLRDLFASSEFPTRKESGRNRGRYSSQEFDSLIEEAVNTVDRNRQKTLYQQAQSIVSRDLPLIPLWYPKNAVVYRDRIGNVKINASGDWSFIKDLTIGQQ